MDLQTQSKLEEYISESLNFSCFSSTSQEKYSSLALIAYQAVGREGLLNIPFTLVHDIFIFLFCDGVIRTRDYSTIDAPLTQRISVRLSREVLPRLAHLRDFSTLQVRSDPAFQTLLLSKVLARFQPLYSHATPVSPALLRTIVQDTKKIHRNTHLQPELIHYIAEELQVALDALPEMDDRCFRPNSWEEFELRNFRHLSKRHIARICRSVIETEEECSLHFRLGRSIDSIHVSESQSGSHSGHGGYSSLTCLGDLDSLVPSETLLLNNEDLEMLFFSRILNGEALHFQREQALQYINRTTLTFIFDWEGSTAFRAASWNCPLDVLSLATSILYVRLLKDHLAIPIVSVNFVFLQMCPPGSERVPGYESVVGLLTQNRNWNVSIGHLEKRILRELSPSYDIAHTLIFTAKAAEWLEALQDVEIRNRNAILSFGSETAPSEMPGQCGFLNLRASGYGNIAELCEDIATLLL